MRAVLVGAVAFILSVGGTAGAAVLQQRHAPAAPAARAADSTKADTAGADTTTAHVAAPPRVKADSAKPHAAPKSVAAEAKPAPVPAAPRAVAKVVAADRRPAYEQLARVFGNMKAADAVQVLAYLSDEEVQGVLAAMGPKKTAELLAAFPKERAAALSRGILHGTGAR